MIVRIAHPDITGNEKTYLTAAVAAGGTSLTVQNLEGFSIGEYLVLGKLGDEKTEIIRVHASTAPTGSAITLNAGTVFAHPLNTPLTYIGFNQVAIYTATSKTGSYGAASGSPVSIEADQEFTEFNDATGASTTWYKVKYYNSSTTVYSDFSDPVQGSGYTENSLRKIIDKANALGNDKKNKIFSEDEKIDFINDGYQETINRLENADPKRFIKKGYSDVKNSYDTGTVAVTSGGTTVTGTGTTWSTGWTGKKIVFGDEGFPYEVASVASTTSLTLTRAYVGDGTDLTASSYIIFQDEYAILDESTGIAVVDFKKVEQVANESGVIVSEFDNHRTDNGYYLKREGENLKLCLNYIPATSGDAGRWTVWYRYQPARLDSMADEPEFPLGYSGLLVSYLVGKIKERAGDLPKAKYYFGDYTNKQNKLIREVSPRTNTKRGFRLSRNLRRGQEHDEDWVDEIYSRTTVGT